MERTSQQPGWADKPRQSSSYSNTARHKNWLWISAVNVSLIQLLTVQLAKVLWWLNHSVLILYTAASHWKRNHPFMHNVSGEAHTNPEGCRLCWLCSYMFRFVLYLRLRFILFTDDTVLSVVYCYIHMLLMLTSKMNYNSYHHDKFPLNPLSGTDPHSNRLKGDN